ncbi:hypothetical protein DR996_02450 [Vibrio owensii]|nr:hypothetical protein DR996_02450 [Vibrio owensii]
MKVKHSDYHLSHLLLMPEGAAWVKESGYLSDLSLAITKAYARISASCDTLEHELFPETSFYLLEEYEQAFGLPECDDIKPQDIATRRNVLYNKDTRTGGLSPWALEELCASYGFDVEISTAHRHHCLRDCTYPIYPYDSQFDLIATVKSSPGKPMTVLDDCATRLLQFDELSVMCILNKYVIGGWEVVYMFEEE